MNKLYRSRQDQMVAGVCGGLAQYLGLDSTLVRVLFAILVFVNGIGIWLYLLLAILTPQFPEGEQETVSPSVPLAENDMAKKVIGGGLVVVGFFALLDAFAPYLSWLRWLSWDYLWPLVLIIGGGALLTRSLNERNELESGDDDDNN